MISDTIKNNLALSTDDILPENCRRKFFRKSYRWILFFFEVQLIIFGKFGHLKDGPQSCSANSDPQESVNLQSIKNRIHNIIINRYAQDSGNITC